MDTATEFNDTAKGFFSAQVGDTIGVFMGVTAGCGTGNYDYFDASADQWMALSIETRPVPIPGAFMLMMSGLIGIFALKRKQKPSMN